MMAMVELNAGVVDYWTSGVHSVMATIATTELEAMKQLSKGSLFCLSFPATVSVSH